MKGDFDWTGFGNVTGLILGPDGMARYVSANDGIWKVQGHIKPRYPNPRPGDLGPNQIAWLKSHIPAFNIAKEAADRVREEVEANKASMGG